MLTLQAILITSSLLLVLSMVGSLMLLASTRARIAAEAVPIEPQEPPV